MSGFTEWRKNKKHLPKFMRDFHDQKDLFKAIDQIIDRTENSNKISLIDAHIYTVDVFLWFMARYGYTLQKTRTKIEFRDLNDDLEWCKNKRDEIFSKMISGVGCT